MLEFLVEVFGKLIYVVVEDDDLEIGVFVVKIDISVSKESGGGEKLKDNVFVKEELVFKKEEMKEFVVVEVFESEDSYVVGYLFLVVVKILKENDIDFQVVKGMGKDGCIIKEDV